MMYHGIHFYEQGLESYPPATIVKNNLIYILWMTLGTIACWYLHPLAGWGYLIFAMVAFITLKKLVCANCYYYNKWCSMGWGKLSALFFSQGNVKHFNSGIGIKLAPIIYGMLSILPILALIMALILRFTLTRLIVLIVLLLLSFYSGVIGRKANCARCKMKDYCAGSAAK